MQVINFYERFGIARTDELEKIQWVVRQRITDEENDPFAEGHPDRMFLLRMAAEAFASVTSRDKYDHDLAESLKEKDPDADRKEAFRKWLNDAIRYNQARDYDLAKTSIDRSMQFIGSATHDEEVQAHMTAATVYSALNMHAQAVEHVNQAVVLSPGDAQIYWQRVQTLYDYLCYGYDKRIIPQLQNACESMIHIESNSEDKRLSAKCWGILAEINYTNAGGGRRFSYEGDNALAEEYALRSAAASRSGEADQKAQRILDDISRRRAEADGLEKRMTVLLNKVKSQKASIKNATEYGRTDDNFDTPFFEFLGCVFGVGVLALIAGFPGFGWPCVFVFVSSIVVEIFIVSRNKRIRATLEAILTVESDIHSLEIEIYPLKNGLAPSREGLLEKIRSENQSFNAV